MHTALITGASGGVATALASRLREAGWRLALVTRQPDWASVLIRYRGPCIDPAALLPPPPAFSSATAITILGLSYGA